MYEETIDSFEVRNLGNGMYGINFSGSYTFNDRTVEFSGNDTAFNIGQVPEKVARRAKGREFVFSLIQLDGEAGDLEKELTDLSGTRVSIDDD